MHRAAGDNRFIGGEYCHGALIIAFPFHCLHCNIGDISRGNYGLREKESSPSWQRYSAAVCG
jgi:hypothetical protein